MDSKQTVTVQARHLQVNGLASLQVHKTTVDEVFSLEYSHWLDYSLAVHYHRIPHCYQHSWGEVSLVPRVGTETRVRPAVPFQFG